MIEEYIKQVENMPNVSDGGSPAYDFGDKILVVYSIPNKYGIARDNEESISKVANMKNQNGVRTPLHLEVKRTQDEKNNYCWVLQTKAPGKSFSYYSSNDPKEQLEKQKILLNAPLEHYIQCVRDISELFHMGLELKPKNVFYDARENGGFTFIDLLNDDPTPLNPNLVSDVLWLRKYLDFITNSTTLYSYKETATSEELAESKKLQQEIRARIFIAMEKTVPNFNQFRRWILRSYSPEELEVFANVGISVDSLELNDKDYEQFDEFVQIIVNDSLAMIASGKKELWDVEVNQIRNAISAMGLRPAWKNHRSNPVVNPSEYEDEWEYKRELDFSLDSYVMELFHEQLENLGKENPNQYILDALQLLAKRKNSNLNR